MSEEKWAFTFGQDKGNRNKYVVYSGSHAIAREQMVAEYGNAWAFQYPWEAFQIQIKYWDLTEIKK